LYCFSASVYCYFSLSTQSGNFWIHSRIWVTASWWGSSYLVRFTKYHKDDQVKEDETGRTCNTHGRVEKCIQNFGRKSWRGRSSSKTLRRRWGGSIIMDLREIGWKSVNWIRLTQDREQWRDLVDTVMNILVL